MPTIITIEEYCIITYITICDHAIEKVDMQTRPFNQKNKRKESIIMKKLKKEPMSTADANELDNITEELPFSFDDDTNTANIGNSASNSFVKNYNTGVILGQLSNKYVDYNYLQSLTIDQLLEELTKDFLNLAEKSGVTDIRIIAHELLEATNRSLSTIKIISKSKELRLQRHLIPAQIGECLIHINDVVKLTLDDTDDERSNNSGCLYDIRQGRRSVSCGYFEHHDKEAY